MKKKAMLALLLALCGMAAFGQAAPLVVVVPLENKVGVEYDKAVEDLTDLLAVYISNTTRLNVIDRTKLDNAMKSLNWQPDDWNSTIKTTQIGGILNANFLLRGTVTQLGDSLSISVRILDIYTADMRASSIAPLDRNLSDAHAVMNGLANTLVSYMALLAPPVTPVQPIAVVPPPPQQQLPQQPLPQPTLESEEKNTPLELHLTYFHAGVGFGFGFEKNLPLGVTLAFELIKFDFEHKATGIGFGFRPLYLFGWFQRTNNVNNNPYFSDSGSSEEFAGGLSFVNMTFYWNIMRVLNVQDYFYFGPYLDLNYLMVGGDTMTGDGGGGFSLDKFIFSAGLQFGFRMGDEIKYNLLAVETGYQLYMSNGNPLSRYFIAFKIGR